MTDRSIILFSGKGGVGKTTCSASVAAHFAAQGKKTMVLTSDMAPSLSDIFDMPIGETVTRLHDTLFAFEISQDAIAARWKARFSRDFRDILSQLIDLDALDNESRHQLLDYIGSAPSLREETMLDLIVDMVESEQYERVIWDTAPAGETLNLLNMPRFIRRHLRAGARVFEGLDKIGKQLIGRRSIADTMDEWIVLSERISRFVRDRTEFIVVANPETLVVRHVDRLMKTLKDYELTIRGMVINRVIEDADSELLRSVKTLQRNHVSNLVAMAGGLPVAFVPLSKGEIRGTRALEEIGAMLCRQLRLV